ncbi:DNA-binding protein [Pseudomonas entomophila]|uniref:DNA-binding protein n=2 Tax=Pseudomonas TaxID=286 RepID=UPI001BCC32AF|nr:DNA-binding protein [Pseudomonas entomophila]QVM93622.1 DNA-binding protein [Pseudomonas entomophila]
MAVGVPENHVFAAADAVLARGERPTVERVRLELGRGSPARVGALLDQWWEQLAERLRGETRLPDLPAELAQAFVAIWQQAITLAQGVAEQGLASQRQVLTEEREALVALEARARLDVAQARQQTGEAVSARQRAETRLADLEQLLAQRLAQIDDLRGQRDELLAQRNEARGQVVNLQQQVHDARVQAEQAREEQQRYTREVEDRAYREIDRTREENKGLTLQLTESSGKLQVMQQALTTSQGELSAAREQRSSAERLSRTAIEQLEQVRTTSLQLDEQRQVLQERVQVLYGELADAQRSAVAQQARADTLETQLSQLRQTLQSKHQRTRP